MFTQQVYSTLHNQQNVIKLLRFEKCFKLFDANHVVAFNVGNTLSSTRCSYKRTRQLLCCR